MAATVLTSAPVSSASIKSSLAAHIDADRILIRPLDLIAYASDASFYRLIPKAVVQTRNLEEIKSLFEFSQREGIPMTFRAAGSSLSGQAISDGLLVEVARHWRDLKVEEGGRRIRVQPGVIGARANQLLAPYGAKIGPDPASIATCTLGGILSNNSSGMCCGVEQNAYHTLRCMKFMLPSGTVIDTAEPDADEQFHYREPELARGILNLKAHIEGDSRLRERVRNKYRTKNTTGYSLNAFLDYDTAVDIFQHVLIGAEGTLAFIAEAVLDTVPDLPVKYTGLLLFPDLYAAADSIVPLRQAGAKALEVMDRASLRSVENHAGIPSSIRTLPEGAAGLLVEFQSALEAERKQLEALARDAVGGLKLQESAAFTHVASEQALLWKIRAGMFPSVGSVRKTGTTVIIEDVAFPIERLADAALDLNQLFVKHDYDNAIIFGHAKDGNLHFVITQGFNDQAEVDQYARFIDDVVELVVNRYDGALKAEHGTGRNMAPFVETEWGSAGYEIMRRLKELADPHNLLNPGVIINADPHAHLEDLKRIPTIEPEVDKCIECGYCESKCPSRELTLTPRQRIVVRREMARLQNGQRSSDLYAALDRDFPYAALDTCATDGLCATACPVSIDTGQLVKRFRRLRQTPAAQQTAVRIAKHFAATEKIVRWSLRLGHAAQSVIGASAVLAHLAHDEAHRRRQRTRVDARHASCRWADSEDHASRSAGGLFSILHLAHHGTSSRRTSRPLADGSHRGSGAPRWSSGLHSKRRSGNMLRNAILFQRAQQGPRDCDQRSRRALLEVVGAGKPADRDRHQSLHLRLPNRARLSDGREPAAFRQNAVPGFDRVRARHVAAQAGDQVEGRFGGAASGVFGHQAGADAEAGSHRASVQRARSCAA